MIKALDRVMRSRASFFSANLACILRAIPHYRMLGLKITLEIPEALATQLQSIGESLPKILELGIRNLNTQSPSQFAGITEVLEFFASLPTPEEIIAFQASEALSNRIHDLLDKNRTIGLTESEQAEWAQYEYVEHLVRIAKAKAVAMLSSTS